MRLEKGCRKTPDSCITHDLNRYELEIEMPGVQKDDISINATQRSVKVSGKTEDTEYTTCYNLSHEINLDKIEATYSDNFLRLVMPFIDPIEAREIKIK